MRALNTNALAISDALQDSADRATAINGTLTETRESFLKGSDLKALRDNVDVAISDAMRVVATLRGARVRLKREHARERRKAKRQPTTP